MGDLNILSYKRILRVATGKPVIYPEGELELVVCESLSPRTVLSAAQWNKQKETRRPG